MVNMNLILYLSVIYTKQKNVKTFGKKVTVYMEFVANLFILNINNLSKDSMNTKTRKK